MGTWKRVLKGYTPLSNPQDISLDFPGATRGSSPAPSPISPLQILKNICIYTVAPVALLWLFYFPKDASDAINGNPYACYANGQMVKGTSLYGYCSSLPTDTTSQHDRVEIGLDRHLTEDQCDTFFPDLYKSVVALFYLVMQFSYGWRDREVDRAESHWRQRGGISRADLNKARDESSATVVIQSNRVCAMVAYYGLG